MNDPARGEALIGLGVPRVERGVFGAMMDVQLVNDGPVTLVIDSPDASEVWTS